MTRVRSGIGMVARLAAVCAVAASGPAAHAADASAQSCSAADIRAACTWSAPV
ncbi:MAG: hypothetical protein HY906_16305 [Deltaproteobacteria bacterium]|nr:hypothetical protein [Deltaproteobacteria bacterium]